MQNISTQAILISRKETEFKPEGEDRSVKYAELKFLIEGKNGCDVLTLRPREFETEVPQFDEILDGNFIYGTLEYQYVINEKTGTAKPKIVAFKVK